ncbi:NAD(P)/FAD-dependent oxidoreductase [Aquimarina brevivitae]|uniref:Glycine/D-amino acid oxidase-like deaminating enzyme n=1 Tax=Aquimarina brevivitae TaxID=323412 RepID=A0A4Q7PJ11_9FLAO|nr:FAD-binding oxidoreductase [Aquimarina brevivitae]RZS99820.1 glycine/D-amino acid oxidase-like deaminating enzyme [Aquimarina brevivitae]
MKVDYIVVGFGLAGLAVAESLVSANRSLMVFDLPDQSASRVAGGVINPVILKRFTAPWNIDNFVHKAIPFYKNIAIKLGNSNLITDTPVVRRFNSVEEQNQWFESCDKPILAKYLSGSMMENNTKFLNVPFKLGVVNNTARLDVEELLNEYSVYLERQNSFQREIFDYDLLELVDQGVKYKGIEAKHIIFTEGYGVSKNPFLRELPIIGNKGEYITIKCPDLQLAYIFKFSMFIIPLGEDLYKVGATFDNRDKTLITTKAAKRKIIEKLDKVLGATYTVVDQVAGIRPTVKDRRPIIGTHNSYKQIHFLNGLGSRGILMAPLLAENLLDYIENETALSPEVDANRFKG